MSKKKISNKTVTWLSEPIESVQKTCTSFVYYQKFRFKKIICEIGDHVLISNADSAEPDTEAGCDAARIISLYEDSSNDKDPFRAKVQWYSRPDDIPTSCNSEPIQFLEREVLEDHRPFDTDVSIETLFKKCFITLTYTKDCLIEPKEPYHYICRYRLMPINRRKVQIEPVLEEERKAIQFLQTPIKNATPKTPTKNATPKTPSSLVKRMSRISISEQKNWSISKNDGTKLLLKRAILADKNEKVSPMKSTPNCTPKKVETPKSNKKVLNRSKIEDVLLELRHSSDDELPTLVIRPATPKRKLSVSKTNDATPKKVLLFDDDEKNSTVTTTRFGRVTRKSVNYMEQELSPIKRTPRKSVRKINDVSDSEFKTPKKSLYIQSDDSDDEFRPAPKTPKTPRTPRNTIATPNKTPKRSVTKKILTSQLTPSLRSRAHSVENIDVFEKENNSLPGREQQMDEILSFVRNKLIEGTSGCMYISGVPGTGKTATVCASLARLRTENDLPDFQLVEVNGMRIAEPRQAYVHIYKQLTGKTVVWEQACALLEKRFTNPGPRRTPTVLLVDELDALCNRRQDVLYSIMEWAAQPVARLAVLAVANTMDLPERALAARVASRLGLTRLTFPPYTHAQLQTIVLTRLATDNTLTADALQLVARKVAAVSGDARRALALCSRACEIARSEGRSAAGLGEVQRALGEAASGAAVRAIKACSPAERLLLRAVAAEVERTGSDETTLSRALMTAAAIVALDGRPYRSAAHVRPPSASQAQAACARLAAMRLLLMQHTAAEPKLLLNVSADDVHYATKQITI